MRVLRGVRATRDVLAFVGERRAQASLLSAVLMAFLVVTIASIAVVHLESPTGNIKTA